MYLFYTFDQIRFVHTLNILYDISYYNTMINGGQNAYKLLTCFKINHILLPSCGISLPLQRVTSVD